MNQEQFLKQLKAALLQAKSISKADIEDILNDYLSHFREGISEGRSEYDIAHSLGEPSVIAKELIAEQYIEQWQENKSFKNLWYVLSVNASLGLINVGVSLPVLLGMCFVTLLSFIFASIAIVGGIFTLAVISQQIFDAPKLDNYMFNTSGVGPMFINTRKISPDVPSINISDGKNGVFSINRNADGSLNILAEEDGKRFSMRKDADGSIASINITGEKGEVVNLGPIAKSSFWEELLSGFLVTLLGLFGFWLSRKLINKLLNFWKSHFKWSALIKSKFIP